MWDKMKNEKDTLKFLSNIGVAPLGDYLFSAAKRYVCKMYGDKSCNSVNNLRNRLSMKHYRKKGKLIDLSLLPPCSSSLCKHTSRAYYILMHGFIFRYLLVC